MDEKSTGRDDAIPAQPAVSVPGQRRLRLDWLAGLAPWFLVAIPAGATIAATIWSMLQHGLSQDTAAWAQAAGSVIAICAAIWISDRENGRRRLERRDDQEASVWAVLYALQLAEK